MSSPRVFARLVLIAVISSLAVPAVAQMPTRVGQTFSFASQRKAFTGQGWTSAVVVSTLASEGYSNVQEETWKPGYESPSVYHKSHVESFLVIAGRIEWTVGGERKVLGPDDCVHVPPFTAFSAKVVGAQDARLLRIYQPGGYDMTQEFIQTLTPAQRGDAGVTRMLAIASDTYEAPASMRAESAKRLTNYFNLRDGRRSFEDDGTSDVAVSSIDSAGRVSVQDEMWKEHFFAGLHYHNTRTETFYVIDGRVEWTVGGETHLLGPGDAVHIPTNTAHTVKELDGKKVHMVMIYEPFGYDTRLDFESQLTPAQRNDPVFQRMLKMINDFNRVGSR